MTSQGFIVTANVNDQRGFINVGGSDPPKFVAYRFSDCTPPLQQTLAQGNIPPNSIRVQFDIDSGNGFPTNIVAI